MRRRPLRHGDADDERHLRADLGRPRRAATVRRLLAERDPGRQERPSRVRLRGRGVLGPRVGAPAAGLRLLLRQAALRPPRRRPSRGRQRAPHCGARLPAATRSLHREPRRASCGGDLLARAGAGRRRDDAEPDRGAARPRGPARGPDRAPAGLPGTPAGRAGRPRPEGVLRAAAGSARRRRLPRRRVAARRAQRLGRQRHLGEPRRLGLARRVPQARGRQPERRFRVRPRLAALGRVARAGLAARRRSRRRALRAQRRRPPRRPLRRPRAMGVAPLQPDATRDGGST